MRDSEFKDAIPTVGLNIEHIMYKRYSLTMWDVGGQATKLWKHYFDHINGILFVIDSTDEEKLMFAREELFRLLGDESLAGVPILLFYNKRDLGDQCKEQEELNTRLDLKDISQQREIAVQACSAVTGEGIWEGMDQLLLMFEGEKQKKVPVVAAVNEHNEGSTVKDSKAS